MKPAATPSTTSAARKIALVIAAPQLPICRVSEPVLAGPGRIGPACPSCPIVGCHAGAPGSPAAWIEARGLPSYPAEDEGKESHERRGLAS